MVDFYIFFLQYCFFWGSCHVHHRGHFFFSPRLLLPPRGDSRFTSETLKRKNDRKKTKQKKKTSHAQQLTWTCAVMSCGVTDEAWSAELALGPCRVVDAMEAVASFGMAKLDGTLRVCIAAAVTASAPNWWSEEAGTALVTLRPTVVGKALVTHRGATGIWTGAGRQALRVKLWSWNQKYFGD